MAEQVTAPSISMALDMKKNRIRIHKPTIHMLGDPILIQLLFDPEAMIVAIICPDREVPGGQEIRVNPKNLKGDNAVEFYSKMFLKKLRAVHGNLDDDFSPFNLSQNAPVPYSPDFIWGNEIMRRLNNEGFEIGAYNLSLEYGTKVVPVYKPYRDTFVVDKGKNLTDQVQDIIIIRIPNESENISAIGWLAKTNYMGSIYEKAVKGIRLRKGNILIGDYQTLNVVFKDARFNGWSLGEIFAIDKQLVPNARRDNFEKNPAYFSFFEHLTTIAANITKDIRAASLRRNSALSSAISQLGIAAQEAQKAMSSGVSGAKKGQITKKLREAQAAVSTSKANGDSEQYYQDIAFAELDMLIGKLKGTTKYKALNTIDELTNTEKRILERVIQTIDSLGIDGSDTIIEAIINEFATK